MFPEVRQTDAGPVKVRPPYEGILGKAVQPVAESINIYAGDNQNADLSNFAIRPFVVQGVEYKSVEQYFQSKKFEIAEVLEFDTQEAADKVFAIADKIMETSSGAQLKRLGNTRIPGVTFNEESWNVYGEEAMYVGIYESFNQNPEARKRLLQTGNAELTHKQDKSKWGKKFPEILTRVREELKKEYPQDVPIKPTQPSQQDLSTPTAIKPGVEKLFDSNPELANQVYEALGFDNFTNQEKETLIAQLRNPLFDLVRGTELYNKYKGETIPYGYSENSWKLLISGITESKLDLNKILLGYKQRLLEEENTPIRETGIDEKTGLPKGFNPSTGAFEGGFGEISEKENAIKTSKNKINVLNKFIQQKQQALQLYSQYLDTGKQDIEGFKDFAKSPLQQDISIDKITDISILNNIILDVVEAVQANLLHVNESMAPLDESTLPRLVADIEAKFPELQAPLEFASVDIETEMGIRNTIGRAMRGLWANFIAGHAVAAFGDIVVNANYELNLDGKAYPKLIGVAGQEVAEFDRGVPINMIGSRYLSAAVDAAKKPYQYTLNDRTFTYPIEAYWMAFSGDTKALHDFLNVPIIRQFTDLFYTKYGAKPILMENALLDVIPKMYKDSLKEDRLRPATSMTREELANPQDLPPARQYELLLNMLKFREAGRSMTQMFKVIAPDSMDGMNSIDSIKSYRSRQNQFNPNITSPENQIFINPNAPLEPVVDQFIGQVSVYGMQRGFSNLFLDIADMAAKIFPMTVSPAMDNLDMRIMDLTGNTQLNPEAHRDIRRAAMLSVFAQEESPLREFFSDTHLKLNYLNKDSNLVTKLRDLKVKYPKLAENLFIRKFVENNDNDLPETKVFLLDFDTSYQMTRFEKDAVTLAAYRLLKRPEEVVGKDASIEDRQSIINLAEDLLMNTLIVHGFKQTTGSYQDLIPVTFFTDNRFARYNNPGERLGSPVKYFRQQMTSMYTIDTFDNFAVDFIRQSFQTSPGGYTLVQGIRKKATPNEIVLSDKDKIRMYRNGYPIPFITVTNSTTNETFLYASGHILTSGTVEGKYVKVNPLGVDSKLIEATNPDKSVINEQGLPLSSIVMTSTTTGISTNAGSIASTENQQSIICK
jgi:ribA/ribD-fused uncharacterized protein